jgi:hypothetical protein
LRPGLTRVIRGRGSPYPTNVYYVRPDVEISGPNLTNISTPDLGAL